MNPNERKDEKDSFWDIDSLVPKRRETLRVRNPESTEAVDIRSDAPIGEITHDNRITVTPDCRRRSFSAKNVACEREYSFDGGLIHNVKIFKWTTNYSYFEQFRSDGIKLLKLHGKPCDHEKFFSYIPQYSQLTAGQLSWYLYLRDCIRQGKYPNTDFSYIMLYVYELINLSDFMKPDYVASQMVGILINYREEHTRLISYLSEWICDFCLINGLGMPTEIPTEVRDELMMHSTLKEFYAFSGESEKDGRHYAETLIAYCTNYDYKKSKFYTPECRAVFDEYITGSVTAAASVMRSKGRFIEESEVTRDTFVGALCSYHAKKRLTVSYTSFFKSHEIRFAVTDTVKYAENRIRASLGVKSKLSYQPIAPDVLESVNGYLDNVLPRVHPIRKAPEIPEYEKLYDLPENKLSPMHASDIERESWDTTEKLIEAFAETAEEAVDKAPAAAVPEPDECCDFDWVKRYAQFILAALKSDFSAQSDIADKLGRMKDSIAEEINGYAGDSSIGDIILEENGGGYSVIDDYRDDVSEMLKGLI